MEPFRRVDVFVIPMLMFSAVVVSALALDPKGFSLKDWQTSMAAILALVAATIAYRGAIAKVNLDREIHSTERARYKRGVFLRSAFAARVMFFDANAILQQVDRILRTSENPEIFQELELALRTTPAIEEAWQHLEVFPDEAADLTASLKVELLNLQNGFQRGRENKARDTIVDRQALTDMRDALKKIMEMSAKLSRCLTDDD